MPRLVAFLRAINVGGHNVTMAALRGHFEALGHRHVETFIASGNVIFSSRATNMSALQKAIEARLHASLGYEVKTLIRTDAEVVAVAGHKPFTASQLASAATLNVAFLADPLDAGAVAAVRAFKTDIDEFHVHGREVYWLCKVRQSDSKFSNVVFERTLKDRATWRNITTVRKLAAKFG
jgi:uncharacterized protein (DUF1697 family)